MTLEMRQPNVEQVLGKVFRDRDAQFGDVGFGKAISGEAIINLLRALESDDDGPPGLFRVFHGRQNLMGLVVVGLEAGSSGRDSVAVLGVQNSADAAVMLRADDTYTHVRIFVGTPRETVSTVSLRAATDPRPKEDTRHDKLIEVGDYLRKKLGT